jgi:hypothetical protein
MSLKFCPKPITRLTRIAVAARKWFFDITAAGAGKENALNRILVGFTMGFEKWLK